MIIYHGLILPMTENSNIGLNYHNDKNYRNDNLFCGFLRNKLGSH
ncbi:MAG: hypothetical protein ACI8WT_004267 [Clostridium sp.]|jgi:hypothetical protein